MSNCPICGRPLYKGNEKLEQKPGKRARRIHRICPQSPSEHGSIGKIEPRSVTPNTEALSTKNTEAPSEIKNFGYTPITKTLLEESYIDTRRSAVDFIIRQSGIPYHFFIRAGDIERIVTAATKGVSLRVEVIPVHESLYDATPEYYNELTEIKWGEDL